MRSSWFRFRTRSTSAERRSFFPARARQTRGDGNRPVLPMSSWYCCCRARRSLASDRLVRRVCTTGLVGAGRRAPGASAGHLRPACPPGPDESAHPCWNRARRPPARGVSNRRGVGGRIRRTTGRRCEGSSRRLDQVEPVAGHSFAIATRKIELSPWMRRARPPQTAREDATLFPALPAFAASRGRPGDPRSGSASFQFMRTMYLRDCGETPSIARPRSSLSRRIAPVPSTRSAAASRYSPASLDGDQPPSRKSVPWRVPWRVPWQVVRRVVRQVVRQVVRPRPVGSWRIGNALPC